MFGPDNSAHPRFQNQVRKPSELQCRDRGPPHCVDLNRRDIHGGASTADGFSPNPQNLSIETITVAAIIPLYNGAPFIRQAIESVISQTVSTDEIIIVDDGSTDAGPAIVRQLAKLFPIKLLSKINGGQSSARNIGIAETACSHIALLDQDDIWYPEHIATLKRYFETIKNKSKLGFIYSNLDRIDKSGRLITRRFLNEFNSPHPKLSILQCVSQDMFILPGAAMFSKSAWSEVGGFDERLSGYEDDDFFLRLFTAGYESVYLKNNHYCNGEYIQPLHHFLRVWLSPG